MRLVSFDTKKEKERQLNTLVQGSMSVKNYVRAFRLLEKHTYMLTDGRRVDRFDCRLNIALRTLVDTTYPKTFE